MEIECITIEMTRRCNMRCEHCLRGDAQNIDVDQRVLEHVIKQMTNRIVECSSLCLTGGEPFLNPSAVLYVLNELIDAQPFMDKFPAFDIVTNGSVWDQQLIMKLIMYNAVYNLNNGDTFCSLCVSTDQFHDGPDYVVEEMFKSLAFYSDGKSGPMDEKAILNEGKAYENGIGQRNPPATQSSNNVYITCTGDVILGCDSSYSNMNELSLGNVLETPLAEIISNYRAEVKGEIL